MNNREVEKIRKIEEYKTELTKDNLKLFEELTVRVRAKSFRKNQQEIEESLFGILNDLIEAQDHQQSVEEYLGTSIEELSDQLLQTIDDSPSSKSSIRERGLVLLIAFLSGFMSQSSQIFVKHQFSWLNMLLTLLAFYFFICSKYGLFYFMGQSAGNQPGRMKYKIICVLLIMLFLLLPFTLNYYMFDFGIISW